MLKTFLVTDSAIEPVTVAEVKGHLRLEDNTEDTLIAGFITAARKVVEQTTRRALLNQTWQLYLDDFPRLKFIELPFPPLVSVTHVKFFDNNGALQTLSTSVYQTDNRSTPGKIVLSDDGAWPSTETDKVNAVEVQFIAGYGAGAASVPSPIRLAIIHLVCHWFENREPYRESAFEMRPVPYSLDLLLMPWRHLRIL